MNRRYLMQAASIGALGAVVGSQGVGLAQATPETDPDYAEMPPDHRARELSALLATLPPVALLAALETMTITEPLLRDNALAEGAVTARAWNDPLDTDIEHALGAVLVVGNDAPSHSEDLLQLGAYIVYETADIAYDQLERKLGPDPNYASMTVAGTKAWLVSDGESQEEGAIALFRVGYVLVIAVEDQRSSPTSEALFLQLATVAQSL